MRVVTPVIGIPNSSWKKKAVKFAKNNTNIVTIEVKDLCYQCSRHKDLIKMFDKRDTDYENSSYFKHSKKITKVTISKINAYKDMYFRIKNGDYDCPDDKLPIITEDGCRLDGSHRLSILEHIGETKTEVNFLYYNSLFSKKERRKIFKENVSYRKKEYNL